MAAHYTGSSWRWACQGPKHVEDNVTYMFILKCALKLVLKNILYDVHFSWGNRVIIQGSVDEAITWSHCVGQWTPVAVSSITEQGSSYLDDPSRTATRKCELLMASKWKSGAQSTGLCGRCSLLILNKVILTKSKKFPVVYKDPSLRNFRLHFVHLLKLLRPAIQFNAGISFKYSRHCACKISLF